MTSKSLAFAVPDGGSACPCGRADGRRAPLAYARCCGRFLGDAAVPAPDAESLMRSRYTAFVLGREDYLRATWAAGKAPDTLDLDPAVKWLGLEVKGHWPRGAEQAEVEFVARYRVAGRAVRLHERSRFVREQGRWYYVDGDFPG